MQINIKFSSFLFFNAAIEESLSAVISPEEKFSSFRNGNDLDFRLGRTRYRWLIAKELVTCDLDFAALVRENMT